MPPSPPPQSLGKKRTRSTESAAGESDDDAPASKVAKTDGDTSLNAEATRDWLVTAAAKHHKNCHDASHDAGHTACHSFTAYAEKAIRAGKPLRPVSRPLRLSTLASVTGVNASRNKTVDILALLDSVDDHTIKRKDIPLYRDIHIIDPRYVSTRLSPPFEYHNWTHERALASNEQLLSLLQYLMISLGGNSC